MFGRAANPDARTVNNIRANEQPRPKGRGIRRVRVVYHHVVLCMLYAASGEELNPKLIKDWLGKEIWHGHI